MLDDGLHPTWNDLATLMIGPSDNTATNAWITRLSVDAINARMQSLGFGTSGSSARSLAFAEGRRALAWKGFRLGSSRPTRWRAG